MAESGRDPRVHAARVIAQRLVRAGALVLLVLGASLVLAAGSVAPARAEVPVKTQATIAIEQTSTAAGPVWIVRLEGWPYAAVNVSICGDAARRGSQDCDQRGTQTVRIQADGSASTQLAMTPPIGCPCVVRGETLAHDLVVTLPVDLPGVPMLRPEEVPPDPFVIVPAGDLEVTAAVEEAEGPAGARLTAALGGDAERTLVLQLHNTGTHDMARLTMSAAVGPDITTGTPLALPTVDHLGPGERRTIRVPVTLATPAYGSYLVHGRIGGLAGPVLFSAGTSATPWALGVAIVVGLVLFVALVGRRRRRRRRSTSPGGDAPHGGEAVAGVDGATSEDVVTTDVGSLEVEDAVEA